jgi:hypothetical protein
LAGSDAAAVHRTGPGLDATQQEDAQVKIRLSLVTALLCCASTMAPLAAGADPRGEHREVREGAKREVREGKAEMKRERHEEHRAIQAARGQTYYWPPVHYVRNTPYYYYYGNARYYGDPGYYYGHTGWDRVSHFHPGGHYCRDVRHVAHYRDGYYRNHGRWYRDGRYWDEPAYVNRYYRRHHHHDHDDDDDDLLRGIAIGAAVVGVIVAVNEAND